MGEGKNTTPTPHTPDSPFRSFPDLRRLIHPSTNFAIMSVVSWPALPALASALNLLPHPEGGMYAETFRDDEDVPTNAITTSTPSKVSASRYSGPSTRSLSTAIYFVVPKGKRSHMHILQSNEMWHFYLGRPLTVVEIAPDGTLKKTTLGQNILNGHTLQHVVPKGSWFGSYPTNDYDGDGGVGDEHDYSLVGCTVAPGFDFSDFELGTREQLLKLFPQHEEELMRLTPPPSE